MAQTGVWMACTSGRVWTMLLGVDPARGLPVMLAGVSSMADWPGLVRPSRSWRPNTGGMSSNSSPQLLGSGGGDGAAVLTETIDRFTQQFVAGLLRA